MVITIRHLSLAQRTSQSCTLKATGLRHKHCADLAPKVLASDIGVGATCLSGFKGKQETEEGLLGPSFWTHPCLFQKGSSDQSQTQTPEVGLGGGVGGPTHVPQNNPLDVLTILKPVLCG